MKSFALFLAPSLLLLACGGSPAADDQPDAAVVVEPDAANAAVDIGVGATVCQGHPDTQTPADIGPVLPDEITDPAAARITPPSYPFTVTSVSYKLTGMEATCGTNIAHAVTVFAAPTANTPPTTLPVDAQRIEVAASATDQRALVVTETLPTPITLTAGEDLFVAVEMDANQAQTVSVCLDGCSITGPDDNRQFWSEQKVAPFTWSTLYSFGIADDYAIWATGTAQ